MYTGLKEDTVNIDDKLLRKYFNRKNCKFAAISEKDPVYIYELDGCKLAGIIFPVVKSNK